MKKASVLLIAALALMALSFTAFADTPEIQKTVYEGFGIVEVEFFRGVQYQNPEVKVQDEQGNTYQAIIWETDDDDITFSVENLSEGRIYSFTIDGVRSGFSGDYGAVKGEFAVSSQGEAAIKEIDYDGDDRELEIEFHGRVEFDNPTVEIMDNEGNSYETRIREKDRNSIELRVSGLERGRQYRAVVSGVKAEGGDAFVSVSGLFTAG